MAIIGVTGRRYPATVTHPHDPAALGGQTLDAFFSAYARSLAAHGASAVYLPREADPQAVLGRVDAIILAGGLDVDPALYGGRPTERSTAFDRGQDEFDLALARAALARGVPLLGTCRGHEVLNVALGGTLTDVRDEAIHNVRDREAGARVHRVRTAGGSLLRRLYGPTPEVNSLHHQAVARPGQGVLVTATSPDGLIEGIEIDGQAAIGVQWHPEFLAGQDPVIGWLVGKANSAAERRAATGASAQ